MATMELTDWTVCLDYLVIKDPPESPAILVPKEYLVNKELMEMLVPTVLMVLMELMEIQASILDAGPWSISLIQTRY